MTDINHIFSQAYLWLSLLGGLHCIGVGIYIRYIYHSYNSSHRLLSGIFFLIGLYFLTGLLTHETSSIPIHIVLTLFIPLYLLLMPLLYIYCSITLKGDSPPINYWKHFAPAIFAALAVSTSVLLSVDINSLWQMQAITSLAQFSHINILAIVFPALLLIQAAIYFTSLFALLRQYRPRFASAGQATIKDIRFRWLTLLTVGILINWMIRLILVAVPFYVGDHSTLFNQAVARFSLLITVYVFAFYGLTQITRMAYLRGNIPPETRNKQSAATQILDAEEMQYLQSLIKQESKQ